MQLHAVDITHSHGATVVLDQVSLTVSSGDRIGLVGPNGVGKSTLLRLLAGIEPVQSGRIWGAPPGLAAGMLPQELDVRPGETLRAYLERRTGVAAAAAANGRAGGGAGRASRAQPGVQRRAGGVPGARRRRSRGAGGGGLRRARAGPAAGSTSPALALWGRGSTRTAGRAAAGEVRHAAAGRADERPRPGGAGAAGALPRPDAGRSRNRHPRPGAAGAACRDRRRAGRVHPPGHDLRRRLGRVPARAGDRPPRRLGSVSRLRRGAVAAGGRGHAPPRVGAPGRPAGEDAAHRQREDALGCRGTGRRELRLPARARSSAGWPASTGSTSRASPGGCTSTCRARPGPARSSPAWRAPSSSAAGSGWGRSTSTWRGASASR